MKNKNALLLILLATCWGPSFLFIKVAVTEMSPMMVSALRIGIGALILNGLILFKGQKLPSNLSFWKKVIVAGFFAQALPFTLINWGEQFVDSSLASVLNGLTPLSTIVLAQLMLKDERMNQHKVRGVLLGLAGLIILVLPGLLNGAAGTTLGILAITLAAISYGVGLVYIRKNLIDVQAMHAPAAQLLSVSVLLLPLAFILEPDFSFTAISWQAGASVVLLGAFGTALAFMIYFKLLERTSAGYVSMVTYLMPIYGVALGMIFLNEALTIWMFLGAVLILSGISQVNKKPEFRAKSFEENLDKAYYSSFR
ncbi:MAG: DMT family transporter [Cyclobacteriaceae bacterium]